MKNERVEKQSFDDFVTALNTKNPAVVEQILSENLHFLTGINDYAETALHLAIRYGNNDIVDLIIGKMQVALGSDFEDKIKAPTVFGSNILHYVAQYGTEDDLASVMLQLKDHMYVAAQQVTHDGQIPIQLLEKNPNKNEIKKITVQLKDYTIGQQASSLSQFLKFDDLYEKLTTEERGNKELVKNLVAAVEAINLVRGIILYSVTHPSINKEPIQVLNDLDQKIHKLRRKAKKAESKVQHVNDPDYLQRLKLVSEVIQTFQLANCQEYAYLVMNMLHELKVNVSASRYRVYNGSIGSGSGHEFVVIGLKPGNDPNDFKTWDKSAVVVDAWGGNAYPASNIPEKLKSHFWERIEGRDYSITTFFNEYFHVLAPVEDSFTLKERVVPEEKDSNDELDEYAVLAEIDDSSNDEATEEEFDVIDDENDNAANLTSDRQYGKLFSNSQPSQPQPSPSNANTKKRIAEDNSHSDNSLRKK